MFRQINSAFESASWILQALSGWLCSSSCSTDGGCGGRVSVHLVCALQERLSEREGAIQQLTGKLATAQAQAQTRMAAAGALSRPSTAGSCSPEGASAGGAVPGVAAAASAVGPGTPAQAAALSCTPADSRGRPAWTSSPAGSNASDSGSFEFCFVQGGQALRQQLQQPGGLRQEAGCAPSELQLARQEAETLLLMLEVRADVSTAVVLHVRSSRINKHMQRSWHLCKMYEPLRGIGKLPDVMQSSHCVPLLAAAGSSGAPGSGGRAGGGSG